jgi:glutamine amidotransferase
MLKKQYTKNKLVGLIDYGAGNLENIIKILQLNKIDYKLIYESKDTVDAFDALILPGVGSFNLAMQHLKSESIDKLIYHYHDLNKPILGICLGMQLLGKSSTENSLTNGLRIFDFENILINKTQNNKVPHMGWNVININKNHYLDNVIIKNIEDDNYFYFCHSYKAKITNNFDIIASTRNGEEIIPSIISKKNTYGLQFHPEKSQRMGLQIFKNFFSLL